MLTVCDGAGGLRGSGRSLQHGQLQLTMYKLDKQGAVVTAMLTVQVDYEALVAACGIADLSTAMQWAPREGLACIAAAVYEVFPETRCPPRWFQPPGPSYIRISTSSYGSSRQLVDKR